MSGKVSNEWLKEHFGVVDEGDIVSDEDLISAEEAENQKGRE